MPLKCYAKFCTCVPLSAKSALKFLKQHDLKKVKNPLTRNQEKEKRMSSYTRHTQCSASALSLDGSGAQDMLSGSSEGSGWVHSAALPHWHHHWQFSKQPWPLASPACQETSVLALQMLLELIDLVPELLALVQGRDTVQRSIQETDI